MRNFTGHILPYSAALLLFWIGPVTAQQLSEYKIDPREIEEQISDILYNETGDEYLVSVFNENPQGYSGKGWIDMNNVIGEGLIFSTWGPLNKDSSQRYAMVGVFKKGSIIWRSEPDIADRNMDLVAVSDLTNDGDIEIVTKWYQGMRGDAVELWIHSFDGQNGRRINSIEDNNFKKSSIQLLNYSIELIDLEPDGILSFSGKNYNEEVVVYSWNGQEYGNWGKMLPNQLPRNGVKSEIQAVIQQGGSHEKLIYKYTVLNNVESLQSIEEFAVKNYFTESESIDQSDHLNFRNLSKIHLVSWRVKTPLDYNRKGLLQPGEEGVYTLLSNGLPKPSEYYVKGNNGDLTFSVDEILTNSVSGITLVPIAPPEPFEASAFTDTLLSYTDQACELEWISNRGICQSLQAPLQNTKRQLERGNIRAAANSVQAFLDEVEAVRRNHLTDEGYALLWFNGEYLLERLKKEYE
jgi:hypothetical protein